MINLTKFASPRIMTLAMTSTTSCGTQPKYVDNNVKHPKEHQEHENKESHGNPILDSYKIPSSTSL